MNVTLAQGSFARVGLVCALETALLFESVAISMEFRNAFVAVAHFGAFETVFVGLARSIERINGRTVARFRHWSIAEEHTVASISKVLSLVEIWI